MKAIIRGGKQRAPKGTWVPGVDIELPYMYHIYAAKTHKKYIREKQEYEEKNNILNET